MLPLEIILPQNSGSNANEISTLLNLFSVDLDACKKDLYPLRKKPYWEKMFSGKTLKNAEKLVHNNDGIDLFLGLIKSIFRQHADKTIKFTDIEEKLLQHTLIVTSVSTDVERFAKTKKGIDNTYTPIAIEFLDRYLTTCTQLKKQIDLTAESDDPTFSLENMVRDELFSSQDEIAEDISDRLHQQLSIEGIANTGNLKPKRGNPNPLKHPNFNQELIDLINKSREDSVKEIKKLEQKVTEQSAKIRALAKKVNEPTASSSSTMSMVGLGMAAIALVLSILGMVM